MPFARSRAVRLVPVTVVIALVGAVTAAVPSAASVQDRRLDITTFNVLAPVWAAPDWYPADMNPDLLDTEFRRALIERFLRDRADTTEVFALQEVQDSEFARFADTLGDDFVGFMARNDRDFWSNWVVDGIPWGPNGTAVFIKRSEFGQPVFDDLDQADGNSIAWVSARHLDTGQTVRIASVHLDSDSQTNRNNEMRRLLDAWGSGRPGTTDVIAGDFNQDTVKGSISRMLRQEDFVDVLAALGNREQTHPWLDSYYMSNKWGVIDHVVVRHAAPISGDVIDSGVWAIEDETARIEANFEACGSDHFPVVAAVRMPA
jgi:endonuclease/exonuclease/phosphatase family metal-dependent hydrolase